MVLSFINKDLGFTPKNNGEVCLIYLPSRKPLTKKPQEKGKISIFPITDANFDRFIYIQ